MTPPRNRPRAATAPALALAALLICYLAVAIGLMVHWHSLKQYTPTGDEPHYLVIASGIINDHTLEQTKPYLQEFQNKKIYSLGLLPPGESFPDGTHAVKGPHGYYNIHNIGLPLILAVPYKLGGIMGARITMVLITGMIVPLAWLISGWFIRAPIRRFLALLPLVIGMPFVTGANQIYPDLPAGALCLFGLWALRGSARSDRLTRPIVIGTIVGILPWLQIRFAPAEVVLVAAYAWSLRGVPRRRALIPAVLAPAALSLIVLAIYNDYAFGNVTGPYESDALQANSRSLMAFLGLNLDQNQGFLLLQPLLLIGIAFLPRFVRRYRTIGVALITMIASMLIPNALHVNLYGGLSMSDRFGWSTAVCLLLPTIFGLGEMYVLSKRFTVAVLALGIGVQAWYLHITYPATVVLYNRGTTDWLNDYSFFWRKLYRFLPAFYNTDWAFRYLPNVVTVAFVVVLLLVGCSQRLDRYFGRIALALLAVTGLTLLTVGIRSAPPQQSTTWSAAELPGMLGALDGTTREVGTSQQVAGVVTYGPYVDLPRGHFRATLVYSSPAASSTTVGALRVSIGGQAIASVDARGTAGRSQTVSVPFVLAHTRDRVELITDYSTGGLQVASVSVSTT